MKKEHMYDFDFVAGYCECVDRESGMEIPATKFPISHPWNCKRKFIIMAIMRDASSVVIVTDWSFSYCIII